MCFNIFPYEHHQTEMVLNTYTILLEKNMVFFPHDVFLHCLLPRYQRIPRNADGLYVITPQAPSRREPWSTPRILAKPSSGSKCIIPLCLTNSWENRLHNRKRAKQSLRAWTHMRVINLPWPQMPEQKQEHKKNAWLYVGTWKVWFCSVINV